MKESNKKNSGGRRAADGAVADEFTLGWHWSYNILHDPKRLAFVLARYDFAAKMVCHGKRVIELGCSEGIGVPMLSGSAKSYLGVDSDGEALEAARRQRSRQTIEFIADDFLGTKYGEFDSVVSLDVIEHIGPRDERGFLETVHMNLGERGACVIGTPNATASVHASEASRKGHVNLFDASRLVSALEEFFHNVFLFGMNDEVVHTGFPAMAHYLIALGCNRRQG